MTNHNLDRHQQPTDAADDRCQAIRIGHALWSLGDSPDARDLWMVVRILTGVEQLQPRTPSDPTAVSRAERVLGIQDRVVYGFMGNLHPKLGTIGLIISPVCLTGDVHGVSCCDTGGLAGRRGSFEAIPDDQVDDKIQSVSLSGELASWMPIFAEELASSYSGIHAYVAGDVPEYGAWTDIRPACIQFGGPGTAPDRRLWTWEVRLTRPPSHSHFEAVVLSHEAFKQLEEIRATGANLPGGIVIAHGTVTERGVQYFNSDVVFGLLCGRGVP